jgi:hypothetical protein
MIMSQTTKTTRYNGLITYVLHQLKTTQNKIFLRYIQDLHVSYQEGTLPKYTPWKLVLDVEDKIRVLWHAEVWDSTKSKDTPAMALNATSTLTDQLKEFLAKQISTEIKHLVTTPKPNTLSREGRDGKDGRQRSRSNPEWVYTPPQNLANTKTVQNRTYYWCTKCNRGNGQWVLSHNNETHKDNYIHPNKGHDGTKPPCAQQTANGAQLQAKTSSSDDAGNQPHGQMSLQDGITNAFRSDVTDFVDDD